MQEQQRKRIDYKIRYNIRFIDQACRTHRHWSLNWIRIVREKLWETRRLLKENRA